MWRKQYCRILGLVVFSSLALLNVKEPEVRKIVLLLNYVLISVKYPQCFCSSYRLLWFLSGFFSPDPLTCFPSVPLHWANVFLMQLMASSGGPLASPPSLPSMMHRSPKWYLTLFIFHISQIPSFLTSALTDLQSNPAQLSCKLLTFMQKTKCLYRFINNLQVSHNYPPWSMQTNQKRDLFRS